LIKSARLAEAGSSIIVLAPNLQLFVLDASLINFIKASLQRGVTWTFIIPHDASHKDDLVESVPVNVMVTADRAEDRSWSSISYVVLRTKPEFAITNQSVTTIRPGNVERGNHVLYKADDVVPPATVAVTNTCLWTAMPTRCIGPVVRMIRDWSKDAEWVSGK
jgi:hypothetical protein